MEAQIAFILAHPAMSAWLKGALEGALGRDPVHLLNDLELLNLVLRRRCEALLEARLRGDAATLTTPTPPA